MNNVLIISVITQCDSAQSAKIDYNESIIKGLFKIEFEEFNIEALKPQITGEITGEMALKEKPDLLILDIRLAGEMNGLEAVKIKKSSVEFKLYLLQAMPPNIYKSRTKK